MTNYANRLPQLSGGLFLTDGGLETTLIFHEGWDLPDFAAFNLLRSDKGQQALKKYYMRHAGIAMKQGVGFLLEGPTWRASSDWGDRLGYSAEELAEANKASVSLMKELRDEISRQSDITVVISGCIGPRGDGYVASALMTPDEAHQYHQAQANAFAEAGADMIGAITMTNTEEAIGVVRAAKTANLPVAISFTVETDGRLPSGAPLQTAILTVDEATQGYSSYFMVNCAHPDHFNHVLEAGEGWMKRIAGIRANASRCSHAELDEAEELDAGDPIELGQQYRELLEVHDHIKVLGGCCGTDHRHIESISKACKC